MSAQHDEIMRGYYERALEARRNGERFEVTRAEFDEMKRTQAFIDAEKPQRWKPAYDYDHNRTLYAMFAGEPIHVAISGSAPILLAPQETKGE